MADWSEAEVGDTCPSCKTRTLKAPRHSVIWKVICDCGWGLFTSMAVAGD